MDPVFEGVGQNPGLVIWRIKQMKLTEVESNQFGSFYSGDSYILLNTQLTRSGKLQWDIHFWIGKDASQDEAGTAAIKSVELDNALGGSPVQHREVQDHESKQFLSYFKAGVRYMEGGYESGFHHVTDDYVKKLFQVKGKRNVRVYNVPDTADSMNKGDCFILDVGHTVYMWVGENCGKMEKIRAIQAAKAISSDVHAGKSKVIIIDSSSTQDEIDDFFTQLGGGSNDDIKEASAGGDDTDFEKTSSATIALHKIWEDDEGNLNIEKVSEKPLKQQYLESDDCFLLDGGLNGIFVWIGKKSNSAERVGAIKKAEKYIEQQGYPNWTNLTRVIDGGEPPTFKQYFSDWKESEDQIGLGRVYTEKEMTNVNPEFNVRSLHRGKRQHLQANIGKAYSFMPDDGTGKVEIWRIENFEMAPLDESAYGFFFAGDSYVLKYTYNLNGRECYIVYFWQGKMSSQDEKAASAIWAVKLDNELCGKAIQVRVSQGAEPEHFLRVFKGMMIVFMGGHASGFRNLRDHDTYDEDGTRMFQVKGTDEGNIRCEQVPEVASSLNSSCVFVLDTPSNSYIWIGKESNEDVQNFARKIVQAVAPEREPSEIMEEDEPDEFWERIGGKGDYVKHVELPTKPLLEARLFKCSTETGKFRVEEICNFSQQDLSMDDVMVLDSGDELFVWIGNEATDEEKSESLKMAEEYIQSDPTDRSLDNTVIVIIKQGEEPSGFTSLFESWDPEEWAHPK